MQKIVVDTNFILSAMKFRIKMPNNVIVPSSVVSELDRISKRKSAAGMRAKIALEIIKKDRLSIARTRGHADKALLTYAAANDCAVATNDKKLIKALKANGIKVIRIRQKKYFVEE